MQVLRESFDSILEIKIYQSENHFQKLFTTEEHNIRRSGIGTLTMAEVPKYILELIGIIIIFLFFLVSYKYGDPDALLATNGLFAVAVIKLLPSLNRIIVAYNAMRAAIPAYNQVAEVFISSINNQRLYNTKFEISSFEKISSLCLKNLTFNYAGDNTPIISDINIKLEKGNIYGFIGASGSGKTTVLNIVSGVLKPTGDKTEYEINDTVVENYSHEIHGHIGYVPQSPQMFNRSILENVAFDQTEAEIDENRVKKVLEIAEALDFVQELPNGIYHVLSDRGMNLSGGQRQRLALARALYRQPSVIILDEATNALDHKTVSEFMETMRQLSKTTIVIIVSHSKSMINFCDQLISLEKGNV